VPHAKTVDYKQKGIVKNDAFLNFGTSLRCT